MKPDGVSLHAAARQMRSLFIGCLVRNALASLFRSESRPTPCERLAARA